MSQVSIISSNGLQNAQAIVNASSRTGVPLYILCAFVQHESNGANVFGHDGGGAYSGGGTVTQAKYNDFLRMVRAGHTSNGVGPMQITYPGYFKPQTTEVANLWQPEANIVFGANIIKGYLGGNYSDANLNRAGQIYNSGRANGAPAYGSLTVQFCHKWKALLGGGPAPTSPTAPATYYFDIAHWFTKAQVVNLQKKIGVTADGIVGVNTIKGVQRVSGVTRDGVVGVNTVKGFQKLVGATQDGKLGPKTAAAAVKWFTPKPTTTLPTLKKGSTGKQVSTVQSFLLKQFPAYAGPIKSSGGADGRFGNGTVTVVKEFQKRSKLVADGIIGKDTWAALKKNGLKI